MLWIIMVFGRKKWDDDTTVHTRRQTRASVAIQSITEHFFAGLCVCSLYSSFFFISGHIKRSFGVMIHSLSICIVWCWPPFLSCSLPCVQLCTRGIFPRHRRFFFLIFFLMCCKSPLMIYILIEFHLTDIDFVLNGKILIKKKVSATKTWRERERKRADTRLLHDGTMSKYKPNTPRRALFVLFLFISLLSFCCRSNLLYLLFLWLVLLL